MDRVGRSARRRARTAAHCPTLTIEFDDAGRVFGSNGCNRFTAGYSATVGVIRLSAAASPRMFCTEPPGVMEQESAFLATLSAAERFQRGDASLVLTDDAGVVMLALVGRERPAGAS